MIAMTCPDCAGNGWLNEDENCITCKGIGDLTIEPTPGPWRILEVQPAVLPNKPGGLWFRAPEGHDGVYSTLETEDVLEIRSTTAHMEHVFGDGHGGYIARIPIAYGPAGRAQALENARAIIAVAH